MKGDSYVLVGAARQPLEALPGAWPGKIVAALYNPRNTVKYFCVFDERGCLIAWPSSLEEEVEEIQSQFGQAVLKRSGSAPMGPS